MKRRTRDEHLFGPGPKRILALDGGGIRGILTLQILRRIEALVRRRAGGGAAVRLCDYFDLIGGTSTGAIIAGGLAVGYSVDELDALYRALGEQVFKGRFFRKGIVRPKFPAEPLLAALDQAFGNVRLGGDEVRTGLAVVLKRLDTGSPWVLYNNPRAKYFDAPPGSDWVPNKDYRLTNVIRASTAAPHFFEPERVTVAEGTEGAFVDGGVSPFNNPSLQLLLLATCEGYRLRWPVGPDRLLLVSVGTGSKELRLHPDKVMAMSAAALALRSLTSIMDDCSALSELLLQWLSTSPTARAIDTEIGDLRGDHLGGAPQLSYLRYDAFLDQTWLREVLGLDHSQEELRSLQEMDRPENLDALARVGRAAGERLVEESHFPQTFDP